MKKDPQQIGRGNGCSAALHTYTSPIDVGPRDMIRPAIAPDLAGIARLNRLVHELHAQNVPSRFKRPSGTDEFLSWFTPVLQEQDSFVVVAEVSGFVVGYLYAKEVKKEESWVRSDSHFLMLHHIAVDRIFTRMDMDPG